MAWTAPRDWVTDEVVTETMMDTHIKDNLRYLKGLDGAITLSDALILPDGAGFYLHIPILTTAQRDALTPTAGMLIYNSTTTQFNKYENGAWRADLGFNSHHGDLSGLTDDDHTIYTKKATLTEQGDIYYASAASTPAALPHGTAGQILQSGGHAANPYWGTAPANITSGSYVGNSGVNRAIAHGLGGTPKLVFLYSDVDQYFLRIMTGLAAVASVRSDLIATLSVTAMDATNFYVGNATDYSQSANLTARTYYWVALGLG